MDDDALVPERAKEEAAAAAAASEDMPHAMLVRFSRVSCLLAPCGACAKGPRGEAG